MSVNYSMLMSANYSSHLIIMLERDKYQPDFCTNYFPNASFEEYVTFLTGPYTFRRHSQHSLDFAKQQ